MISNIHTQRICMILRKCIETQNFNSRRYHFCKKKKKKQTKYSTTCSGFVNVFKNIPRRPNEQKRKSWECWDVPEYISRIARAPAVASKPLGCDPSRRLQQGSHALASPQRMMMYYFLSLPADWCWVAA